MSNNLPGNPHAEMALDEDSPEWALAHSNLAVAFEIRSQTLALMHIENVKSAKQVYGPELEDVPEELTDFFREKVNQLSDRWGGQ